MKKRLERIGKWMAAGLILLTGMVSLAGMTFAGLSQKEIAVEDESTETETELTPIDLGYWFQGIDEDTYSARLRSAANSTPTTGVGYCAAWVSYVYQAAGLGFVGGNACDMWQFLCNSNNADDIREGMIIAVRYSPTSELGMLYGHCGVILKNKAYQGEDLHEQIVALETQEAELEAALNADPPMDNRATRAQLLALKKQIKELEEQDQDIYDTVKGCLIQADPNGNEKWLVADSTTGVGVRPLSSWIRTYDVSSTVAWGWGHAFSGRVVVWTGDLPSNVPFVYHEENETALRDLYGIDMDHITDDEVYGAIAYVCGAPEDAEGTIRLYGGAFVNITRFYELLGHMTQAQFLRWTDILTRKAQEEQQAAEAARLLEEQQAAQALAEQQAEEAARLLEEQQAEEAARLLAEQQAAEEASLLAEEQAAQMQTTEALPEDYEETTTPEASAAEPWTEAAEASQDPQTALEPVSQEDIETQPAEDPTPYVEPEAPVEVPYEPVPDTEFYGE